MKNDDVAGKKHEPDHATGPTARTRPDATITTASRRRSTIPCSATT